MGSVSDGDGASSDRDIFYGIDSTDFYGASWRVCDEHQYPSDGQAFGYRRETN